MGRLESHQQSPSNVVTRAIASFLPSTNFVRFRNGPLFVKSSKRSLAAGFVLPYVVDKVAAT